MPVNFSFNLDILSVILGLLIGYVVGYFVGNRQ